MPFGQDVTKFAQGNYTATLLRILPGDPFLGLVRFDDFGTTLWVNSVQLQHFGWRPRASN
jgi:hypothetical protein